MQHEFDEIIEERFRRPQFSGPCRVMPLDEAVRRLVQPGMALHSGITHHFSYAALYEIMRQFWGKDPGFTLISLGARVHGIMMVRGRMLKKIISTFCGDVYPSPGPNPVFNRAYLDGAVEFENWSVLTLPLRLMAGAMGLPCITTNSLAGSSMERDNNHAFTMMDDPFRPGEKIGLLKALVPDLSIVHGLAADEYGNTLFTPPYAEELWGALAARHGVLVTVERVVTSEYIRRHAFFCKLPGSFVRAVCVAPYGAHPGGLKSFFLPDLESYSEDYDFSEEFTRVTRDEKELDNWLRHWILDCRDHNDYVEKIGYERLMYLKGKAQEDSWETEIRARLGHIEDGENYNAQEWMIIAAARKLKERIRENGYKRILAGIGMSNLAAWLAAYDLRREGVDVALAAELGFIDYNPRPADPFIFNHANIPTCAMLANVFHALGVMAAGANNHCIGALGAAQVDRFGNINSTKIPDRAYLTGSGGANDVLSGACESMLVVPQAKNRLVNDVPYISGCGARVRTLVTTLGVFEKPGGEAPFALTAYFAQQGKSKQECLDHIAETCGWELEVADSIEAMAPPTQEELRFLRLFDPDRHFLGELNPDEDS